MRLSVLTDKVVLVVGVTKKKIGEGIMRCSIWLEDSNELRNGHV